MSGPEAPSTPREARNSVIQGRFERLREVADKLEMFVDELAGNEDGHANKPAEKAVEPFGKFWESLSERIDAVADRIEKCTEEIRQMIL